MSLLGLSEAVKRRRRLSVSATKFSRSKRWTIQLLALPGFSSVVQLAPSLLETSTSRWSSSALPGRHANQRAYSSSRCAKPDARRRAEVSTVVPSTSFELALEPAAAPVTQQRVPLPEVWSLPGCAIWPPVLVCCGTLSSQE